MLFTSLPFVLFLAATLLLYYIIPKKLQWGFLLVASYVFYALADLRYLIFIMTTTVTVWYVAKRVEAINLEQKAYIKAHKGELSKEDKSSSDLLKRFNSLLRDYYFQQRQLDLGVPSVQYCADQLAYSARYLGDVVHKATGGTAIGYIHSFVIEQGKNLLMNGHNINETAHLLGFDYPQHFTRLFKRITGLTPRQFTK